MQCYVGNHWQLLAQSSDIQPFDPECTYTVMYVTCNEQLWDDFPSLSDF